jgi:hypothetical protein
LSGGASTAFFLTNGGDVMSFMGKTINAIRLRVPEDEKIDVINIPDMLIKWSLMPIDDTFEEKAVGWASIDDPDDLRWDESSPWKGEYVAFSMRTDTRKIPSSIIKQHVNRALKEEKAKNPEKNFISRERKQEITEQVKLRLRKRIPPVSKTVDVIWDVNKHLVHLIGSASDVEPFLVLFLNSFGIHLVWQGVTEITGIEDNNSLRDTSFTGDEDCTLTPGEFFMRDFLSFLWFYSEEFQGHFNFKDVSGNKVNVVAVASGDNIVVADRACMAKLSANDPQGGLAEAKSGLLNGKKVVSATYTLVFYDTQEMPFKMDTGYAFKGLKFPKIEKSEDGAADGEFLERIYLLERAWAAMDAALLAFTRLRTNDERWRTVIAGINSWVRNSTVAPENQSFGKASDDLTEAVLTKWLGEGA